MAKHWWAQLVVGHTPVSDPLQTEERPDARFEVEWRGVVKSRVLIMLGCLACWAVTVEARLVWVQVVDHQAYVKKANNQHLDHEGIEAPRGDILDRRGRLLATNVRAYELGADPRFVTNPGAEAQELCQALGDCAPGEQASIAAKLGGSGKWVMIRRAREMSPDAAMGVQALIARLETAYAKEAKLKKEKDADKKRIALILTPQSVRVYPNNEVGAQVVGVISADGKAGAGVEWQSHAVLKGNDGSRLVLESAPGVEMFSRVESAPQPGASVELTLNVALQHVAQTALGQVVRDSGALSGTAIVLQAGTGDVLVMASYPDYNPFDYATSTPEQRRNRAVQDTYEPGSTFKFITASAAINEGVMTPETVIDTNPGLFTVPGRGKPIKEAHGRNYGPLSLAEILAKSSNVGAAKVGRQVGAERMAQYARRFGLGQKAASDLAGEEPGRVEPLSRLTESALASMSIGYQVAVTPLQMATAISVFANGGLLIKPHIVRAIIRDGRREEVQPQIIHRVVTPETALALTAMLEGVVEHGTGKSAGLQTYRVAGKTGTAQVVRRGYSADENNVSFAGFVPSRDPEFIILVLVNSPRGGSSSGATIAAPVFRRIAEAALQYDGVQRSINPVPPIMVAADRHALPAAPRPPIAVPAAITTGEQHVMPDLRGMTLRDALRITQALGLEMTAKGAGVVESQSPPAGESLDKVRRGVLELRRETVKSTGGGK